MDVMQNSGIDTHQQMIERAGRIWPPPNPESSIYRLGEFFTGLKVGKFFSEENIAEFSKVPRSSVSAGVSVLTRSGVVKRRGPRGQRRYCADAEIGGPLATMLRRDYDQQSKAARREKRKAMIAKAMLKVTREAEKDAPRRPANGELDMVQPSPSADVGGSKVNVEPWLRVSIEGLDEPVNMRLSTARALYDLLGRVVGVGS